MGEWEPLFDELKAARAPEVLHEALTGPLGEPIAAWVDSAVRTSGRGSGRSLDQLLLEDIQASCNLELKWSPNGTVSAASTLKTLILRSDTLGLEVANYLLSRDDRVSASEADRLGEILRNGLSVWQVVPASDRRPRRLERRVGEHVELRFEDVSAKGRAGEHLRVAWGAMYGRDVSSTAAYREAVKAVEAAAQPVITPTDELATLGKMLTAFRDKPEKWDVPLGASPDDGRDVLRQMMAGVLHGQHDRHGTSDETRPASVGPEEAEAALHAAITLVHLFTSGLVKRIE